MATIELPARPVLPTMPNRSLLSRIRSSLSVYLHAYTLCTIYASIGGFLFGYDTGSIGPITVMSQFLDIFSPISPILHGFIVSSILLTASTASFFAGPLCDRISRIYTFAVGGAVFAVGSAISASAKTLPELLVGRCVAGVGEGLFLSTITVYTCEIAPTAIRGTLACTTQLFVTFGIAAGYFICYGTVQLKGSISWRFPFAMQAVAATLFTIGAPFLPHSPRWLRHVGRHEEALRVWTRLGVPTAEAEKEDIAAAAAERVQTEVRADWKRQLRQVWAKDVRKRTALGCFLMLMSNLCGIDGVLYYAPVLFTQAGLSSTKASFLASGVSGLLNVACTIVSQPFTDKWGRRPSVIIGGSVIASSMLIIASIYASHGDRTPSGRWAIIVFIYVFIMAFSVSWAISTRIYASEIQPMQTRAAATSMGQSANWIGNWAIAFTTPLFLAKSGSGPYFLFGGFSAFTVLVCIAYQSESKGVSLEELDEVFKTSPWRQIVKDLRLKVRPEHREIENIELASIEAGQRAE